MLLEIFFANYKICEEGIIEIPYSINGYKITEIGDEALRDCSFIQKLIIKAPITKISYNGIRNIRPKEIYLPPTLETIDTLGLYHFPKNISIIFPIGIHLKSVNDYFLGDLQGIKTNIYYCALNVPTLNGQAYSFSAIEPTIYTIPGGPSSLFGKPTTVIPQNLYQKCINPYFTVTTQIDAAMKNKLQLVLLALHVLVDLDES